MRVGLSLAVVGLALSAPAGAAVIAAESGTYTVNPDQELLRLSYTGDKPGFWSTDQRQHIRFVFRHDGQLADHAIFQITEIHSHYFINGQYAGGNDGAVANLFPAGQVSFGKDYFQGSFYIDPEEFGGDPAGSSWEMHYGADVGYVLTFLDQGAPIHWTLTFEAVPEPGTWMTMIMGFGLLGAGLRRNLNRPARGHQMAA